MKKRLLSALLSGAFLLSSVSVFNTDAGYYPDCQNCNTPQYRQEIANYVEFENDGFFNEGEKDTKSHEWTKFYYKKNVEDGMCIRVENYYTPYMDIRLRNNDDTELVSEIIKSYDESYYIKSDIYDGITSYTVYGYSGSDKMIYHARKIYQDLKELAEIVSFDYHRADGWCRVNWQCFSPSITSYAYDTTVENRAEVLQQYIDDNNLDFTVVTYDYEPDSRYYKNYIGCYLKPNYDIGFEEHLEVAKKIKNDLGYTYMGTPDYVPDIGVSVRIPDIDVCNSIDGDSNGDGELTVADATLILQYVGNSDKYKISPQGEFNADIVGDGDGVSALDALEIQKILANR